MVYFLPQDSTTKHIRSGLLKAKSRVVERKKKYDKMVLGVLLWENMVGAFVKENLNSLIVIMSLKQIKYLGSSQYEKWTDCKRNLIYFKLKLLQLFLCFFRFW